MMARFYCLECGHPIEPLVANTAIGYCRHCENLTDIINLYNFVEIKLRKTVRNRLINITLNALLIGGFSYFFVKYLGSGSGWAVLYGILVVAFGLDIILSVHKLPLEWKLYQRRTRLLNSQTPVSMQVKEDIYQRRISINVAKIKLELELETEKEETDDERV